MSVGEKKFRVLDEYSNPSHTITGRMLYQLSYGELVGEQGHLLGSYVTNVLHTATISVPCGDSQPGVRKMVNFEVGPQIKKDDKFSFLRAWDKE